MKSITIQLLKYFNSTCTFLLPVKLNVSEISRVYTVIKHIAHGSCENEALENEDRSTKHPKLENEAPYLENEVPKNSKPVCPL